MCDVKLREIARYFILLNEDGVLPIDVAEFVWKSSAFAVTSEA